MADPDIIPKYVPALSSTGDVPVFLSPPPAPEEDATPPAPSPDGGAPSPAAAPPVEAAGGEPAEPPTEPTAEEPAPEAEPPAAAKPPRPDPRTVRMDRLEGMLERAIAALATRAEPPPAPVTPPVVQPPPDPKPARANFDNPEDYDAALVQWGTRAALAEHDAKAAATQAAEKAAADKKAAEDKAAEQQKAINDQWMSRRQESMTKRADYQDVEAALIEATNEFNGQQTAAITAAIMTAPDGPDLAYYLGKNPAEAKRIALVSDPMLQLFEMGKISAKLAQPKPVEVSRTPPPIVPLRGPSAAHEKTLEEIGNEPGNADIYIEAKRAKRAAEFAAKQGQRPH